MVEEQNPLLPSLCKYIGTKEERLTNRDVDIFNLIVSFTNCNQLKENISKESRVGRDKLNIFGLKLVHFCLPIEYHFPKFVTCCVQNYSDY